VPHKFLVKAAKAVHIELPALGSYGVGMVYLPKDPTDRARCEFLFERVVRDEGQTVLGWRDVPTNNAPIGPTAIASEPLVRQIFIGKVSGLPADRPDDPLAFERKLYVIRKLIESAIKLSNIPHKEMVYLPSLSARTLIYKGMLNSPQVDEYFPDLRDPLMETALALVHSRFSTNTFPSWPLAHPYRILAHNGEINTVQGNENWMRAREGVMASEVLAGDLDCAFPICTPGASDTARFDEALELLNLAGRPLHHAILMMIPEAWENHESMDAPRKAFYRYHAALMEPWDGPASIAFSDGTVIGAVLDRNGLRPSRYWVTDDDRVIMASEVGVLDIDPAKVVRKGRLQPGRMFLIDLAQGRIIEDDEIKRTLADAHPYADWLEDGVVELDELPEREHIVFSHQSVLRRQQVFGYTHEELKIIVAPMAKAGSEPIGSMGTDTPIAVLSAPPAAKASSPRRDVMTE
jgi:glutamate synthase domain-containing protein 1